MTSSVSGVSGLPAVAEPSLRSSVSGARPARGAVTGAIIAIVTYAALTRGALPPGAGLVLAVVLLVAVPTAKDVSRRLAVNGASVIGWQSLLWWVDWPIPVDHVGLLVAVVVGVMSGQVVGAPHAGTAARRLVPTTRAVDLLLVLGGVLGTVAAWRWVAATTPTRALAALLPGYDNSAHYGIFMLIERFGVHTSALGPSPDGSSWDFAAYPQGFHTFVAALIELAGARPEEGPAGAVAYARGIGFVVVLAMVLLTAAIVSLPALRDRPLVALPAAATMWTAFLWEPGLNQLVDGFASFWLAAAMVGLALILGLAPQRRAALPETVAVLGVLVLVAQSWTPLLVIAAPALLSVLHPLGAVGRDRAEGRRLLTALVVVGCALLAIGKALLALFSSVGVGELVSAVGGIHPGRPFPVLVLVTMALCVPIVAPGLVDRHGSGSTALATARRARLLLLAPVGGVLLGAALLTAQLVTMGTSAYYFLKFLVGFELVLAAFVPAVCAFVAAAITRPARRRWVGVLVTAAATVAVTQGFGWFPAPRHVETSVASAGAGRHVSAGLVAAVEAAGPDRGFHTDYLDIGRDRAAPAFYSDIWYHAMLGSFTADIRLRTYELTGMVPDATSAMPMARRFLVRHPQVRLVVAPRYVSELRGRLGDPDLARRVTSWSP